LEKAQELLTAEVVSKLEDSNWKERLDGIEKMSTLVKRLPKESIPCQVCVRTIAKKPGFKDNNFQVSTMYWRFDECVDGDFGFWNLTSGSENSAILVLMP